MAVLQKLRTKFGLAISIIVGLGLLSFIIDPGQIESAVHTMSSKFDVGRIAGKKISYTDFQENINKFTTINEILTGSSVQNEQAQKQIRDAAWQDFIDKFMFVKNAKAAGIRVGDDELLGLISGDNVSPMISQNPIFMDESGNFSVDRVKDFTQQVNADESGRLRTYWNYLQNTICNQQYYAKYGSLFTQSNIINALQVDEDSTAANTTANIDYVLAMYPISKDSTINVSAAAIKKYYNDHKNFFKQNASRDIEYVVYEVVPSVDDINATAEAMATAYAEFQETENMKAFLLKNSDMSLSNYWYKAGELKTVNADIDEAIFGGQKTTQIVQDGNSFFAAKVVDEKMVSDSVYVKHILLQGADAKRLADSLAAVAGNANFANLAAAYSVDQNSAADNEIGNIGWMTQTYMIPGFESVITAEVGKPYVINTQYGTHVVLVSKKTAPIAKKQVAVLEKTALASKETYNKFYSDANTFVTIANGTEEGYQKAVDSTKIYSHKIRVTEATSSYGAIDQAKELTRWVFDNKAGKASNIITINNKYFFVATVKGIHKEGYTPLSEVSQSIESNLYSEQLRKKYAADVKEKIAGLTTLEEIAGALGSSVDTKEAVSFSSISNGAMEPALLGAALNAEENVISGPVSGIMGVYVYKVSNKQTGEFYTKDDARMYAAQKAQYSAQMIIPTMMEAADVKDNRERFF